MRRDILTEIGFILVIFLLGFSWIAIQVSAYRSQYPVAQSCRVLDIQLSQVKQQDTETDISRIYILTDRDPQYQIESRQTGEPIRVRFSQGDIDPALQKRAEDLANALVQNLWIQPETNGPLTVGLQLTQPEIQISDSLIQTPNQHGVVLDLAPSASGRSSAETQWASLQKPGNTRERGTRIPLSSPSNTPISGSSSGNTPDTPKKGLALKMATLIPRVFFTSACQIVSIPAL